MFNKKNTAELELNYRGFIRIEGSDFLVSPLSSREKAFKGVQYVAYNYLFLNTQDFSMFWLFNSNNQIIKTFYQIPLENSQTITENIYQEKLQPFRENINNYERINQTGWLLFVYTKIELNQDKKTIAISDSTGKNLIEVLHNINSIYDKIRLTKDSIVLMYSSDEKVLVSEVMLSEKRVV